jgi:ketosteroid isomerase-like protein
MASEADVITLLQRRSAAIREKDIDRLMSFYSRDIVYFDLVPPLQYTGAAALRERFVHWFGSYQSSIVQELHNVTVSANGDVATASMLIRSGGTLRNGHTVGFWVRATSVCRRSDQGWLITHEHVSLPVDLQTGRAVADIAP